MAFTTAKLNGLKPKDRPYKVSDYDGLYVLVNPNGSKLWRFKYRIAKSEKLLSLGAYPALGLQDARMLRDEARANLANGIDPAKVKRDRKAQKAINVANTFAAVAELYLKKKKIEGRAAATLKKNAWIIDIANADIGHLPMSDISPSVVLEAIRKREALGQYDTAKTMRSVIGAIFRYGVASSICDNDPTFALKDALISPKRQHRAAITNKNDLQRLLKAIDGYTGQAKTKIGLKLLILFATRPGELRHARWEEFDFENRVWHIPAERMKMRKEHHVPLPDLAIEQLEQLKELTGWGELLFPSQSSSKKPISENTFNQALRRMGFGPDEVTSHGFRATFSTLANESGKWHPDAIERAIAHVEKNEVRRAYDRGIHWEQRVKLANWWAEEVNEYQN